MSVIMKTRVGSAIDLLTQAPVGVVKKSAEQNAKGGYEAQAFALVQSCIAIAISHGTEWLRIVAKLCDMETAGRAAFRKGLDAHKKLMGEHVKASDDNPVYVGAKSSAIVRFSQLKTISRAMDAGFQPACKEDGGKVVRRAADNSLVLIDGFYAIYGQARAHLASQGASDTRGRKEKTFTEKLSDFIKREGPSDGELAEAEALVHFFAEAVKGTKK
jgi:hypothetical protein